MLGSCWHHWHGDALDVWIPGRTGKRADAAECQLVCEKDAGGGEYETMKLGIKPDRECRAYCPASHGVDVVEDAYVVIEAADNLSALCAS